MNISSRLASVCAGVMIVTACAVGAPSGDDTVGDGGGVDGSGVDGSGGGDGGGCTDMCSGKCANLKTDTANCGMCGKACPADAVCAQGTCQCGAADGGARSICNGQCVDTKSDVANCGMCGFACGADGGALLGGGTWTCTNGTCGIACAMPKSACLPAGCFDLQKDGAHCGSCGKDCSGALCIAGSCCMQGEIDCNGVCTNTKTDANNCGMCGTKCSGSCVNSVCQKSLVGSYNVINGPAWGGNPPCYTCQEGCAIVFGGTANQYSCSTTNQSITGTANTSIWGISGCAVVADTFKKSVNYNCGSPNCSQSAYVQDNCTGLNYCFK